MSGGQPARERWGDHTAALARALTTDDEARLEPALVAVSGGWPASVCLVEPPRPPRTVAATDPVAAAFETRQLEAGEGPLLSAFASADVVVAGDLRSDDRWPALAADAETEVRSALCVRLGAQPAVLSWCATSVDAFTAEDVATLGVVAPLVGLVLQADLQGREVRRLELALQSSRKIGAAMGVLMTRELLTEEQAFARLVDASQRLNRKVRDIAEDVQRTGELPVAPPRRRD